MLMRTFLKQNSLIFAGVILLLGAQITLALSGDKLKDSEVSVVVDDGSFSHARILSSTSVPCSYGMSCSANGDVTDDSVNYFTLTMAPYTTMSLHITVGEPARDVTISLSSTVPIATMTTDVKMWPDSSYPYNYINTIYGSTWSRTFSISKSLFQSRGLDITIENGSSYLSTVLTFKIEVTGGSSINLAWLIPVIIVGVVAILVGIAIYIRQKRRRRARSAMVQQVGFSNNTQNISSTSYQQTSQSYPVPSQPMQVQMQAQPQYFASYTPVAPQNMVYQDMGPLSAMNFDTRFPEMLAQNIFNFNPSAICSLCYKDFQFNPRCRQLYCGHIFHSDCAKPWLLNQMQISNCATCPGCNANVTFMG